MLEYAILCFSSFITLINPIGIVPTFLSLTDGYTNERRKQTARKASATLFVTIVVFALLGDMIFNFFGVTIKGLRIVGGIVLIRMGMDLLSGHSAKMKKSNIDTNESDDISITPLGFPILCGAGTITTALVMSNQASSIELQLIFYITAFVCSLITYIVFKSGDRIMHALGKNGRSVMNRLMGLVLTMVAIEFFFAGLRPFLVSVGKEILK